LSKLIAKKERELLSLKAMRDLEMSRAGSTEEPAESLPSQHSHDDLVKPIAVDDQAHTASVKLKGKEGLAVALDSDGVAVLVGPHSGDEVLPEHDRDDDTGF
jgi:hypothetical protein